MTQKNISFNYMYRDASNYKRHGQVVFANQRSIPVGEIEKKIRAALSDGKYFIARQVDITECFFGTPDKQDDHPWHEFCNVRETKQPAFDPKHEPNRDIAEFIESVEKANRDGWDETKVREDIAELLQTQTTN